MAAPIRFTNIRPRLIKVCCRRLMVCDQRNQINTDSSGINSVSSSDDSENIEDFFGIPNNFKLRQMRVKPVLPLSDSIQTVTTDENDAKESSLSEANSKSVHDENEINSIFSRRQKRKPRNPSTLCTNFGTITVTVTNVPENSVKDKENLAHKITEIFTTLNNIKQLNTADSRKPELEKQEKKDGEVELTDRQIKCSKANKNNSSEGKEAVRKEMKCVITEKKRIKDSLNESVDSSHDVNANYFDEVYFPENSTQSTREAKETENSFEATNNSKSTEHLNILSETATNSVLLTKENTSPDQLEQIDNKHHLNVVDDQYFGSYLHERGQQQTGVNLRENVRTETFSAEIQKDIENSKNHQVLVGTTQDLNEIDRQYFGDSFRDVSSKEDCKLKEKLKNCGAKQTLTPNNVKHDTNRSGLKENKTQISPQDFSQVLSEYPQRFPELEVEDSVNLITPVRKLSSGHQKENFHLETPEANDSRVQDHPTIITNQEFLEQKKKIQMSMQPDLSGPKTAYEVAMRVRQSLKEEKNDDKLTSDTMKNSFKDNDEEKGSQSGSELDSKGFRLLDRQVPDLDKMTSADLVRLLKKRIIFDNEDFLAIDKPYGLPCIIGQSYDRVSLNKLLPALVKHLPSSYKVTGDLHLVQGLDRDVTGAIILAKTPEVAYQLTGMFKESQLVTQRFWAITKGVPQPYQGVVDIPIGEAKVGNIYRAVLRPRFLKEERQIGQASDAPSRKAVTEYRILGTHLQSALVECVPLTDVKHQVRLHLASGLGTPILGDHKYSNFSKLAPQKLHKEMLDLLKIRQATTRHLALHLHCRSIILNDYKGCMIFLTTHPPYHFRENLRSLRIPKPKK